MAISVGELEARLHADVSSFVAGLKQATQAFQNTNKTINQGTANMNQLATSVNGVQSAITKLNSKMNMAFGAIGAGFVLPQIFSAAKSAVIDFNQQVDQASVALTNFLGSATASKKMIGELQDFAARTPFQFKDLLGTTQSMMAMGVAADEVLPRMQAIGDAAAAMGGSPETLQRIQRALGQIQAKGRVQSEELLQLAEAGIPAYQYLAETLGTTTADMMDDLRKGTVDSATAIKGILDGMNRDFGGMMEEQSKTMMGAMSTVMDYVQMTVGAIFRPIFETLRDAFVAISELLSSNSMKKGASDFAKGIASVISTIKSLIASFATTLKKPFMDLIKSFGNVIAVALRLANTLKPMAMAIVMPLAGAISMLANAISPILKMFTALAEVVSRNQVVMFALAGILMSKMVMGYGATGKAAGALNSVVSKSLEVFGSAGKEAATYFRVLKAEGQGTFAALKISSETAGLSVKAFGAAIKTALVEILPMVAAFMVVGKAMEAFSNRNRDAKERTQELTAAIREQIDTILAQENALNSLSSMGLDPLNNALKNTGKEGEETTNALISLGKSSSDYLQTMRDFKGNTEQASYAIAKQRGFTDEQAKAMANYVSSFDKGKDSTHRARMEMMGFTPAMIAATMAMEQLDDASENTNFAKMTQEIINATIRSNEATQRYYDEAKALAEAAKASGTKMSKDEEAIFIYENFIRLVGDFTASLNEQSVAVKTAADRVLELAASAKDGKVEMDAFQQAFLGADASAVNATRSYFELGQELASVNKKVKESKGNVVSLQNAGNEFADMFFTASANIQTMGGTLGDVRSAMSVMIENFKTSAKAAGFTDAQITDLLNTLGILKGFDEITVRVDADVEAAKQALLVIAQSLKLLGGSSAKFRMYEEAEKKLMSLQDTAKTTLPTLKAINDVSSGGGSKKDNKDKTKKKLKDLRDAIRETYEDGIAKAKDSLDSIIDKQKDYMKSVSDAITSQATLGTAFDQYQSIVDKNTASTDKQKTATENLAKEFGNAISSAVSFTGILQEQKAAQDAVSQATQRQTEVQQDVADKQKIVNDLQNKYASTRVRKDRLDILEELKKATADLAEAQSKLSESNKAVTSAEDDAKKAGSGFLDGLGKQVQAARDFADQLKKLRDMGLTESALRDIAGAGAVAGGQIAKELISGGVDAITKTNELTNALSELSTNTGIDLADSFKKTGETVATSLLGEMQNQATKATAFAEKIKTLVQMGLSQENLQMVLQAGADAGTKIADELINGGQSAITTANMLQSQLKTAADSAATAAGSSFYDAGKNLATDIYNGLVAKWNELAPKLKDMNLPQLQEEAKKAPSVVNNLLNPTTPEVNTPSTPFFIAPPSAEQLGVVTTGKTRAEWIDQFLSMVNNQFSGLNAKTLTQYFTKKGVAGMASESARRARWEQFAKANNVPALADGGIVKARNGGTLALLGEGGQNEAVIPLPNRMTEGGNTYHITIEGSVGMDMQRAGKELVKILQEYERRNGRVPLKAVR